MLQRYGFTQGCYKQAGGVVSFSFRSFSSILEALGPVHDILFWFICIWGYSASSKKEFPNGLHIEGQAARWGDLHAHSATQAAFHQSFTVLSDSQMEICHLLKSFAMQIFHLTFLLLKLHREQTAYRQNRKHCWLDRLVTSHSLHVSSSMLRTRKAFLYQLYQISQPDWLPGPIDSWGRNVHSCTEPRWGLTSSS